MSIPKQVRDHEALMRRALAELRDLKPQVEAARLARSEPIAIVGLGCRFPGGGHDADSFWQSLKQGVDGTADVPPSRWNVEDYFDADRHAVGKMCTRRGGFIDDLFGFDPRFFDILPREAASMDPQQRLLLEVAYQALEHANIPVDRLYGSRTGVFVGISTFDCAVLQLSGDPAGIDAYVGTGSALSAASGRLSYTFGLTGPSLAVDTACSSSLVAAHLACASLRSRECDMALVGGVNALILPAPSVNFSQAGMLAPDGRCKTFDARADGYARGEGCGVLVLKRLSDANAHGDAILALIRGSAVNQDGPSGGLTVPNGPAQEAVIRRALESAEIAPEQIAYVEAHGTGTSLGDPIEVNALAAALCKGRAKRTPLLVGSVKTNIGHCEAAAGVAGLVKVTLSLMHREIPPHLHFEQPNPHIDWDGVPIEVVRHARSWPEGRPSVAGVSSFGFSGTNAHVILEEAPRREQSAAEEAKTSRYLLPLSARTPEALGELTARFDAYLASHAEQELNAICRTAAVGRRHFAHRVVATGASREHLREQLAAFRAGPLATSSSVERGASRGVAFLFTGQGSQYPDMGKTLYQRQPVFRAAVDRCDEILRSLISASIVEVMYGDEATAGRLAQTEITQPALFSVEYALSELWRSWGVSPSAVAGHSVGEYVAALAAGVFELEDGLRLISARARLMQGLPAGLMAAVFCGEQTAAEAIRPYRETVAIAAVNAPELVVISGAEPGVRAALADFDNRGIGHALLNVSGAFHSPMVGAIVDEFRAIADRIRYRPSRLRLVSNITGADVDAGDVLDAAYWCRHLMAPVRFADSIATLVRGGHRAFLEIGPHPVLTAMAKQSAMDEYLVWTSSLARGRADDEQMLAALGELYVAGVDPDWEQVHRGADRRPVTLPTYPFQHRQYPIVRREVAGEPPSRPAPASASGSERETPMNDVNISASVTPAEGPPRRAALAARLREMTQPLTGLDPEAIDPDQNLFAMGFDSITLMRLRQAITKVFGLSISMSDLSQLDSLSKIAAYLDESLPPDAHSPLPQPAVAFTPVIGRSEASAVALPNSELGAILAKQLDLMARQLELLRPGAPASPVAAPRSVAARPSSAAPVSLPSFKRLGTAPQASVDVRQQEEIQGLVDDYGGKTTRSKEMTQRYRPVFANIRNVAGFRPEWKELIYQIVVDRAAGSKFTDIDGREYLDISMGFGVYLFGHRPDFIHSAVRESLERGAAIGPMCADAGEVARRIHEMTGVDRVAFFNTGSEAVMSAIRLARTVTRRPKIVMFAGSYHGHTDNMLATGHGDETLPMIPGTPESMVQETCVLPYGEEESLDFIEAHAHELAAVIVEPVQSRRPEFQPAEFLRRLRDVTERTGTALIFDEVILGFRVHPGGAQASFGVQADLVTYGKTIGGGMPIGIVAGTRKFMDAIDGGMWRYGDDSAPPVENTFVAGTFNHHPLAMAAARAVLEQLEREGPDLHQRLNRRTADLARRLNDVFTRERVPIAVVHYGSLFRFKLTGEWELLWYYLLARGVYIWEGRNCFLSTAHTDDDLDVLVRAVEDSVAAMIAAGASRVETSVPAPVGGAAFPLTAAQYRLYVLGQLPDAELSYHIPVAMIVDGPLDESRVRAALHVVAQRHEAMRTSFVMEDERIVQRVETDLDIPLERVAIDDGDIDQAIAAFMRPFDLASAPLARMGLGRLPDGRHLILFDAQHIVFDGMSIALFFGDFMSAYAGERLPPLAASYRQYVEREGAYLQSADRARDEAYWLARHAGDRPAVELPLDRPRPGRRTFAGLKIYRRVDAALTRDLKALARRRATTLNVVLLAAHFTLLQTLTGADDLCVGCGVDGRSDEDLRRVVGMFVNTIALRARPSPTKTVAQFLDELKQQMLDAQDHSRYPYDLLVEKVGGTRDKARNPLFDTTFVYENLESSTIVSGNLTFSNHDVRNHTAILDLTQDVAEMDGGLNMSVEFNTDVFDLATVEGFIDRYVRILSAFARGPEDLPLHRIDVGQPERPPLPIESSQPQHPARVWTLAPQRFEAQAARNPDAVAAVCGGTRVSYGELNARANQMAHHLRERGIGADTLVGVCLPRSTELLVALLGVWKAGGAYVPIDPAYPAARKSFIARDAQLAGTIDESFDWEAIARCGSRNPGAHAAPVDLAYVMYTSGSTGQPKGAMITHAGLANYLAWAVEAYGVAAHRSVPVHSSIAFDLTVTSLYSPLVAGGTVELLPEVRGPEALVGALRREGGRALVKITPAHLSLVTSLLHPHEMAGLVDVLVIGGETLSFEALRRWREFAPTTRLINEYGPTETVVGCSTYEVRPDDPDHGAVPIGRPIDNVSMYVLDEQGERAGQGATGEIYIGGAGVARGYLNRPELTAERFIRDPYSETPGGVMYRSGDLGRCREDGQIECLGRTDNQVKIHGYRIELGEIESALRALDEVADAAVVAHRDTSGSDRLVAYVVAAEGSALSAGALRRRLGSDLPEYMVPSACVVLDRLPLTENGKVDRRALPPPEAGVADTGAAYEAPRDEVQKVLADVWQGVLRREHVSIHDNFFDLGGDSIKALQVVMRLKQRGYSLKVADLFDRSKFLEVAELISRTSSRISAAPVIGPAPLTPVQSWFAALPPIDAQHFNQCVLLWSEDRLQEAVLRTVLARIQEHHDTLRMRYRRRDGQLFQENAGLDMPVSVTTVDLRDRPGEAEAAMAAHAERVHGSLDLEHGPLMHAVIYQLPDADRLLLVSHHLVVDGVSWRILLEDVASGYGEAAAGRAIRLPAKTHS